uniref:Uncharacterized protein n=1 Tax=Branchiostoma floridae TaxID=7739 RepID=C3XV92_BRAFL|eukprot:XP_002612009.1 hypothetical protein BRAFLDRAFT_86968 [Branchiostoma floridae]
MSLSTQQGDDKDNNILVAKVDNARNISNILNAIHFRDCPHLRPASRPRIRALQCCPSSPATFSGVPNKAARSVLTFRRSRDYTWGATMGFYVRCLILLLGVLAVSSLPGIQNSDRVRRSLTEDELLRELSALDEALKDGLEHGKRDNVSTILWLVTPETGKFS